LRFARWSSPEAARLHLHYLQTIANKKNHFIANANQRARLFDANGFGGAGEANAAS